MAAEKVAATEPAIAVLEEMAVVTTAVATMAAKAADVATPTARGTKAGRRAAEMDAVGTGNSRDGAVPTRRSEN